MPTTKPKKVYWVRHGYSESNYIRDSNPLQFIRDKVMNSVRSERIDPALTNFGVAQAKALRHVPLVQRKDKVRCCSASYRAIQTAYYAFPKKKIFVIPFVHEKGGRNVPQITNDQEYRALKRRCSGYKNIDWSILDNIPKTPELGNISWGLFNSRIRPKLPKRDIIIVSHSKTIKEQLGRANDVLNCGVYSSTEIEYPTGDNHGKLVYKAGKYSLLFKGQMVPYIKYFNRYQVRKFGLA